MIRIKFIVGLLVATAISTAAAGQMSLDLDPAPGDQGVHEKLIKPGETFTVELVATGGAKGIGGFSADLKFDKNQVTFKGYNLSGLMASAVPMPPKSSPSGTEVYAAILGGVTSEDSGSLGHLLFEARANLTRTHVKISSATFGFRTGPQTVGTGQGVTLFNPDAPAMPPQGNAGQHGFQSPPEAGTGPQNQGFQPPQGQGFQNPRGDGSGVGQHGGQRGDDRGRRGGDGPEMSPEDVISKLPEALQPAFRQTMEVEHNSERARIDAELAMLRSVRGTLEQTKQFLASASQEDQETIAKALWFFHTEDRDEGPMGGPPGQRGGPMPGRMGQGNDRRGGGPSPGRMGRREGPGGPGTGMPDDVNEIVKFMIEEVEREIQQLEQELQHP